MNQRFIYQKLLDLFSLKISIQKLEKIKNTNGKVYLLACGGDKYYNEYGISFLKEKGYYIFDEKRIEERKKELYIKKNIENKLFEIIDGIIPVMYEYAEPYRNSKWMKLNKVKKTIPLAIDTKNIIKKNKIGEKIIIFHGLNSEKEKGTAWIREAMENIQKKYSDKVEIIIDGKMPLEKYKEVIAKTNILIDQCRSYGYGMNALYGMAMGKLVFSGNEPENEKEFGEKNIPVVNITPNVEDIEKKLEYYILNPELIITEGKRAREFVERFHDSEIIAKQYLKLFEKDSRTDEK